MATDSCSNVAERLPWQRATEDSSPAENAGQISARNVAVKVPQVDEESVLPVQEDESPTAHKVVGSRHEVLAH